MKTLVIVGAGARDAEKEVKGYLNHTQHPFVVTWGAKDMFPYGYPNLIGGFGVTGTKEANKAVQEADYLIVFGCSLNTHHTGSNPSQFAPKAYKVVVDIDIDQFDKKNGLHIDSKINQDLKEHLREYY